MLEEIRVSLLYGDRLSFWKNRCLVKSLAGRWMLNRRGIVSHISFGLRHDDSGKLIAHAWLTARDFEVVEKGEDYTDLAAF